MTFVPETDMLVREEDSAVVHLHVCHVYLSLGKLNMIGVIIILASHHSPGAKTGAGAGATAGLAVDTSCAITRPPGPLPCRVCTQTHICYQWRH